MIPFKLNVLNSQICKENVTGSLGLGDESGRGGWWMIAKGYEISFGGNENARKL